MPRKPDAMGPTCNALPGTAQDTLPAQARAILRLLGQADLDAAIEAGLPTLPMDDRALVTALTADELDLLCGEQHRLRVAWAARERHQVRNARVVGRAEARAARQRVPTGTDSRASLPGAAAAALARARAKASGKG